MGMAITATKDFWAEVARAAKEQLERRTGESAVSPKNARQMAQKKRPRLE